LRRSTPQPGYQSNRRTERMFELKSGLIVVAGS
jgi:hypothetical protein